MKPWWSSELCTVGGSRTTEVRTPRAAVSIVRFSASMRGPPGPAMSSVPIRPGAIIASSSVPEVPTKGLPVPASASSIASIAARSASAAPCMSPERIASCLNARWMTPSASAAAERSRSRSSIVPGSTAAPAALQTAARESDRASPVTWCPAARSSGIDGGPDVPAGPGDENAHDAEPPWFDPLRSDLMRLT